MCLYSKVILNPKYKPNKKNGGKPPILDDERKKYVPIGCTQCIECRKQKGREWTTRLEEHLKEHKNGKFVTLTFSNEEITELIKTGYIQEQSPEMHVTKNVRIRHKQIKIPIANLEGYEKDNAIATAASRRFLERWRKKYGKSVQHWLITELGHKGTENIHLHGIIWTNESLQEIEAIWGYGRAYRRHYVNGKLVNYVNIETVGYMTKYVSKVDQDHKEYRSKILSSPGIGSNYTKSFNAKKNKYNGKDTEETYRTHKGYKIALPTYWRNKIYSETEREILWVQKIDKKERWICGERIDISKGEEDYYKVLEWHRKRNKQLGYGNGEKDWSREHYEWERREIMYIKRLETA